MNRKFLDEAISRFDYEDVVKSWIENPTLFVSQPGNIYPTSWFREPFSLLAAMFYRLYGEANCTFFKAEWVPATQHIVVAGESFNWAQIISINLKEQIDKYQKN